MSNNSSTDSEPLAKFCAFFEKVGAKRLAGLDEGFIHGMNQAHRAKAWTFLEKFDYRTLFTGQSQGRCKV
jgi:hypothetical protein